MIDADFESLTTNVEGPEWDPEQSHTQDTQLHDVCSNSYIVVRSDGKICIPHGYRGPNAAERFLR